MAKNVTTAKQIEKLREELRRHEYLYFVQDEPEISDVKFDRMMEDLKQLEARAPGTRHPGFAVAARGRISPQRFRDSPAFTSHDEPGQHLLDGRARGF